MISRRSKSELLEYVRNHYSVDALCAHVIEIKSQEACDINNRGIESQFEYLYKEGGHRWLEETFVKEDEQ